MFHQPKQHRRAAAAAPHRFELTPAEAPPAPPARARGFTPHNRLARILTGLEEQNFDDLFTAAPDRFGRLEGAILAYVQAQLAAMKAIHAGGEAAVTDRRRELGDLAIAIAEVAGAGKLAAISQVARGVRTMTESPAGAGTWCSEALGLHISCLSILTRDGEAHAPAHAEAMLRDLKTLRAALGVIG